MVIVLIFIVIGLCSIPCCSIPHRTNALRLCKHEGCMELFASFGNEGGKAEYCVKHKPDSEGMGMVNVRNPKCRHEECMKHPSFGNEGGKAEYCSEHKPDGMVDVRYRL